MGIVLLLLNCECLCGIEILTVLLDVEEPTASTSLADICIQYSLRWLMILVITRAVHSYGVK
jgi:hypothetical protein